MPITIKDIARQAGVSHTTVSRALRGNPQISDETVARIRKIAIEMGYFPSAAARSLKTNRSQVLGVILSNVDDPFFSEILQGIEEGTQDNGYSLFIAASQNDPEREQTIVQTLVEHRVEGVIICSTSFSEDQGSNILQYGVPIVVVNNQAAEDFRYSIYHDDTDGSRQITRHLIELGHSQIAYIGNRISGRTNQDRLSGFKQEMEAAGLHVPKEYILEASGGRPDDGSAAASQLMGLANHPTAIICFNDMLAIGVLRKLDELDMRVPQDVSVTGFDDIVFSAFTNPPLTTFNQPKRFIGSEAARLLLDLLETSSTMGLKVHRNVKILKGELQIRKSTAPPPTAHNRRKP